MSQSLQAQRSRCYLFQSSPVSQYTIQFDPNALTETKLASLTNSVTLPKRLERAAFRRKRDWILGRYCAQLACSSVIPHLPLETNIPMNEDRSPEWPQGITGSITHTEGYVGAVACAATIARGLGIDTEKLLTDERLSQLIDHIASFEERDEARHFASSLGRQHYYTLLFSAKEALYKCLYPQVKTFFGFEDVKFSLSEKDEQKFLMTLKRPLSESFSEGTELSGSFLWEGHYVHTTLELTY